MNAEVLTQVIFRKFDIWLYSEIQSQHTRFKSPNSSQLKFCVLEDIVQGFWKYAYSYCCWELDKQIDTTRLIIFASRQS